ncbi:6390_t:CDS:2 [Dentiscutata heterogama]|uniref:6390_t:CDS:1 n=1 Tax=Dentiscutata heterogama TaxID=1316150 RepID=A0ACA9K5R3_9GLOM|nr:6390_t:CDS:2 [Dentiscutata heterogama]
MPYTKISSWINRRLITYDVSEIPFKFKLLLRGSRDGFSGKTFHRLCDNIPNTVVVVKINGTNEIIGGYNPLIWKVGNSNDEHATTTDSFIFALKNESLNESILSRVSDPSTAIWYGEIDQGPWFSGYDFGINSKNLCCCNNNYGLPDAYEKLISSKDGWFSADEFEVFQIYINGHQI